MGYMFVRSTLIWRSESSAIANGGRFELESVIGGHVKDVLAWTKMSLIWPLISVARPTDDRPRFRRANKEGEREGERERQAKKNRIRAGRSDEE